jgi:hypothetical protein
MDPAAVASARPSGGYYAFTADRTGHSSILTPLGVHAVRGAGKVSDGAGMSSGGAGIIRASLHVSPLLYTVGLRSRRECVRLRAL